MGAMLAATAGFPGHVRIEATGNVRLHGEVVLTRIQCYTESVSKRSWHDQPHHRY